MLVLPGGVQYALWMCRQQPSEARSLSLCTYDVHNVVRGDVLCDVENDRFGPAFKELLVPPNTNQQKNPASSGQRPRSVPGVYYPPTSAKRGVCACKLRISVTTLNKTERSGRCAAGVKRQHTSSVLKLSMLVLFKCQRIAQQRACWRAFITWCKMNSRRVVHCSMCKPSVRVTALCSFISTRAMIRQHHACCSS